MKHRPWFIKRNTLTALTLIAGLSLGAQTALAEPSQHQPQRWDYIFTQLDVTEEQQAQVRELFNEMAAERRAKMQEHRAAHKQYREANGQQYRDKRERRTEHDREAWQAERQARQEQARQNLEDRLSTILAPDQVEGFITYLDAHKPMRKHHRGRGHKAHSEWVY